MKFLYRGYTTKALYSYAWPQIENADGEVLVNGELACPVNTDGSIQRGYAGPSPTVYDAGAVYSTWEKHV